MLRKDKVRVSTPTRFSVPVSTLISLLQGARQAEPPEECHTEIQTELKEGAKGKIVCVGKCKDKEKKCEMIRKDLGKKRKLVACVCDEDDFAEKCNLIVVVKGDEIETSFCVGDCPKDKKCERGVKIDGKTARIFCFCN